jgi:hypothetical protein
MWGISDWHLTLPPSALKQWTVKSITALTTSFLLGLVLPVALFVLWRADDVIAAYTTQNSFPPLNAFLAVVLGQLAFTSAAVYAGSICSNTMWAMLAGLGISLGLPAWTSSIITRAFPIQSGVGPIPSEGALWAFVGVAFFGLICLLQWFAYCNFRQRVVSKSRLTLQLLALFIFPIVLWFLFSGGLLLSKGM